MENIRFSADWTKDGESLKSESKGLPSNAKPGIIHLALPVDMTNDDEQVGEFRDSENYFGLWDEMQWRSWSSKKELLTVPKDNFQRQTLVWAGWSNGPPYLGQVPRGGSSADNQAKMLELGGQGERHVITFLLSLYSLWDSLSHHCISHTSSWEEQSFIDWCCDL